MLLPAALLPLLVSPKFPADHIPAAYLGKTLLARPKTTAKLIALTFDDGPDPRTTPLILDALRLQGARATFFVLGPAARRHPDLLRRIANEGHAIGTHTMTHARSTTKTQARAEIEESKQIVKAITGRKPLLFRPPFGIRNSYYAQAARIAGQASVHWTATAADTATQDPHVVFRNVCFTPNPGEIVLLHDTKPHTAKAIPKILAHLQAQGFSFVTLPELLRRADPPKPTTKPTTPLPTSP